MDNFRVNTYQDRANRRARFLAKSSQEKFYLEDGAAFLCPNTFCAVKEITKGVFSYFTIKRSGESFDSFRVISGNEIFSISKFSGIIYDNFSFIAQHITGNVEYIDPLVFKETMRATLQNQFKDFHSI